MRQTDVGGGNGEPDRARRICVQQGRERVLQGEHFGAAQLVGESDRVRERLFRRGILDEQDRRELSDLGTFVTRSFSVGDFHHGNSELPTMVLIFKI